MPATAFVPQPGRHELQRLEMIAPISPVAVPWNSAFALIPSYLRSFAVEKTYFPHGKTEFLLAGGRGKSGILSAYAGFTTRSKP